MAVSLGSVQRRSALCGRRIRLTHELSVFAGVLHAPDGSGNMIGAMIVFMPTRSPVPRL
jgi:hypothetical protein